MLAAKFNPHRDVVDRYENLLRMVAFRYGVDSQGVTFVLYDELIALRHALVDDPGCVALRAWAAVVAERLGERYRSNLFPTTRMLPSTVVGTKPIIVEFSRTEFEERYRAAVSTVSAETVEVVSPYIPDIEYGRPYMFVIDDRNRMLIWARSFLFEELVFGRNRATVAGIPVAHPMLVPERLRASAAGEIVVAGTAMARRALKSLRMCVLLRGQITESQRLVYDIAGVRCLARDSEQQPLDKRRTPGRPGRFRTRDTVTLWYC